MKRPALAALLALACTELTGDFGEVVAIEILSPRTVVLEERDTVRLEARALDAQGNVLDDAPLVWEILAADTDTAPVGIVLDTLTGHVAATAPGSWPVRARVETLPTDPITVRVTAAPDSVAAAVDTTVTVAADQTRSAALQVIVLDLTTVPDTTMPLGGKDVTYRLVHPVFDGAPPVALTLNGEPGPDPLTAVATTATDGRAAAFARRQTGTTPDSVVIWAAARTAVGDTVPGSPVRFVVHFESN